ncbi:MAG: hypothetical protein IPJ74_24515 [Saprospiraceae bacterium]|nr:hypothetical protein [Saprospiraceae bacterium]
MKVNETVYLNDKPLKKKDIINSKSKLRFSSGEAFAYVMSPNKGYFILGIKDRKKAKGEFILALEEALVPPNDYYAAATRTHGNPEIATFEDQYDLKAFFRDQLFFIVPAKFKVSAQHFPLDSNHFFMVKHYLKDGWFGKALPQSEQSFELNQKLFQLHDKVFDEKLIQYSELYFSNQETGEDQYLGRFTLEFLSQDMLLEELTTLYDAVGKISADQFLHEHVMPYLNLQYGKTQPEVIAQLVNKILER